MKRNIILLLALMIVGSIAFICCKDSIEDELPKPQPEAEPTPVISIPLVGAVEVTEVTTASISYSVSIKEDGGASITGRGVCYSTKDNPTIIDDKTSDGKGTESFSGRISDLSPDVVYYVRAYAINSKGTSYGPSIKVPLIKQETLIGAEQAYPGVEGEVVTTTFNGREITCRKINSKLFYQGDILITNETETRGIGIEPEYKDYLWPNNTLIYEIHKDFPDTVRIGKAIAMFSKTNILFKKRTNEENYVLFYYEKGCGYFSQVGMQGKVNKNYKQQKIKIDLWGTPGVIAHEICHALGLLHEHSKPKFEDYIIINWDNIIEGKEKNFAAAIEEDFYYTEGFDFNSIMLYDSYAWAKRWLKVFHEMPTITKKDGSTFEVQRDYLSKDDIRTINHLYPLTTSPSAPQLLSPINNASLSELISFAWEESTNADDDPFVYDLYWGTKKEKGYQWTIYSGLETTKIKLNKPPSPGTYYWKVIVRELETVRDPQQNESAIYKFTITENIPILSTPILTSPTDRSIFNKNNTREVDIRWESVSGANEYWLNVFPEGKASSPIFNESVGSATNKQINLIREENGIYIIQVKARRTGGEWSEFSDSHKIIIDTPSAAPFINAPKDNVSILRNSTQTFSWSKPTLGIDRYYMRIVKGSDLNATPIYEPDEFKENSKNINCTWEPGTYTWSVRAMKETPKGFSDKDYETSIGWGEYAESRSFEIVGEDVNGLLGFSIGEKYGIIDESLNIIFVEVPTGSNISRLAPQVSLTPGATVTPASGATMDFTHPVTYKVTSNNGSTKTYNVIMKEEIKDAKEILLSKLFTYENGQKTEERLFEYDKSNRLITYTETGTYTPRKIEIVYDNNGKITQLNAEGKIGKHAYKNIAEVTYIDNNTIHLLDLYENQEVNIECKPDIIKLNNDGKMIKRLTGYYIESIYGDDDDYNYNDDWDYFEYDSRGNIIKITDYKDDYELEGDYYLLTYDNNNGMLKGSNIPEWLSLYLDIILLSGQNNMTALKEYSKNGQLEYEDYTEYFYNPRTNYPVALLFDNRELMIPYYQPKY